MNMIERETFDRVVGVGVDLENDFGTGGALAVPNAEAALPPFNRVGQWIRNQNGLMVFTRDAHRPDNQVHFSKWPVHCIDGTWGAEFVPGLDMEDGDTIINKGTDLDDDGYSGFEGQDESGLTLETIVMPRKRERVAMVVGGWATDYCDLATVRDGCTLSRELTPHQRYLGVFALTDCMRAVDIKPGDGQKALQEMVNAGARLITSEQLLAGQVMEVRN